MYGFTGHENDTDVEETLKPTLVAPPGLKIVNRGDTPTSPSPNLEEEKEEKAIGHEGFQGRQQRSAHLTVPYQKDPHKCGEGF